MGFAAVPMGVMLALYRRRKLDRTAVLVACTGAALWLYRRAVVPGAWEQSVSRKRVLDHLVFRCAEPIAEPTMAGLYWVVIAACAALAVVTLGSRLRWRIEVRLGLAALTPLICVQLFVPDGTWLLLLMPGPWFLVTGALIFLLGAGLFVRYRRTEPGLVAGLSLICAFLPTLQYVGYHYLYWPGAFLGLADACFASCFLRWAEALRTVTVHQNKSPHVETDAGAPELPIMRS